MGEPTDHPSRSSTECKSKEVLSSTSSEYPDNKSKSDNIMNIKVMNDPTSTADRVEIPSSNINRKYTVKKKEYSQQFCHLYNQRLVPLRKPLLKNAQSTLATIEEINSGKVQICEKISNLPDAPQEPLPNASGETSSSQNPEHIIIGTLFKDMKLRSSVLDEYRDEIGLQGPVASLLSKYISDDDKLLLEDESGRALLDMSIDIPWNEIEMLYEKDSGDDGMKNVSSVSISPDDMENDNIDATQTENSQSEEHLRGDEGSSTNNDDSTKNEKLHQKGDLEEKVRCSIVNRLCTGLVIGVRGYVQSNGSFKVLSLCPAGIPPQAKVHSSSIASTEIVNEKATVKTPNYVLLASGMNVGETSDLLSLELLTEYITGNLFSPNQNEDVPLIGRVVIAGNIVVPVAEGGLSFKEKISQAKGNALASPIREADVLLAQIAAAVPLDIMPGNNDPANNFLPQQALNPCLFPFANRMKDSTLNLVTNPYEVDLSGELFLGSSGQPIEDMDRYTDFRLDNQAISSEVDTKDITKMGGDYGIITEEELQDDGNPSYLKQALNITTESKLKRVSSRLRILMENLRYRHLAPTAPDTLPCYPFPEVDPFIISKCPSVFFAGNQPQFETCKLIGSRGQRTQIICIPDFSKTGEVVLVDVNNDMKTKIVRIHSKVLSFSRDAEEAENTIDENDMDFEDKEN